MHHLARILRFGWPYLQRYFGRLAAGVLLAIVFGFANTALLWAVDTTLKRMSKPEPGVVAAAGVVAEPGVKRGLGDLKVRLQTATDRVVDPWLPRVGRAPDWRQIAGGLLLFPLLAAIRGFVGYASSYCLAWVSERVVNDLRIDVLRKLTSLSLDYFNRSTMGDLLTRVNGDTHMLQRCLSGGLSDLVKEPVTIVGILVGLFVIDWEMTLFTIVFFPLVMVPIVILGKKVRRAARASLQTNVNQASLIVEILSGIRMVKAFNLETPQLDRFRRLSKDFLSATMRMVRAKEITNPIIEVAGTLGFGALVVVIVLRRVEVGEMVTLLTGAVFIYTPVKKLAGVNNLIQQTHAGVERLFQILQEKPSISEPEHPEKLAGFSSGIEIEKVSFSYGHTEVLRDISISIPRGTKLGIAGESGSGKSTLVNLLYRFYDPTAGVLRIDGHDLRSLSVSDLREQMALVSQEIVLFDMSVAENIACGRQGASRAEIEAAARGAFAHEFISRMPEGYDTRVAERGTNLSGGQRQRLAIARAFVRNAPILVLDEATAALDAQSEAEVQAAIEQLERNRTVICVAHRLSTLRSMDRIVVLSAGRIVEEGSFEELLRNGGLFADMARRQGISARP